MTARRGRGARLATLALAAAAIVLLAAGYTRGSASDPRALLDAAIAAHGGREALARFDDFRVVSDVAFKGQPGFVRTLNFRAPATWSMQVSVNGVPAMSFGVDAERCWREHRAVVGECSPPGVRHEYTLITAVLRARFLRGLDTLALEPAESVAIDGVEAPALRAGELLLVFDPATHRLVQIRYDRGWIEDFSDFRVVSGALVAMRRRLTIGGVPDVDETWREVVPGGADPMRLRPPEPAREGGWVNAVDPERWVAWMEVSDLERGVSEAVAKLDAFAAARGVKISASDGVVFTESTVAGGDRSQHASWHLAIGLEAPADQTPVDAGDVHVERWPPTHIAGIYVRGDPRSAATARRAVERRAAESNLVPAPGARWQLLCSREALTVPLADRLSLLRIAIAPRVPSK